MNMAVQASRGSQSDTFRYGSDGKRTRSWGADGSRVYLPGYEHRTDTGETKVYVGDYAVITRTGTTRKVDYLLKDRLGSVDAVANSVGSITEARGYDPFGKPRDGNWADRTPATLTSRLTTPKGFTQHEHLDALELIHMNGRVFEYHMGRFTGVDPFIQFPLNSQSLNPYSYILNNPLSGTDPTGYKADCGDVDRSKAGGGTCSFTTSDGKEHSVKYSINKDGQLKLQTTGKSWVSIINDNEARGRFGGAQPIGVTGIRPAIASLPPDKIGVQSSIGSSGVPSQAYMQTVRLDGKSIVRVYPRAFEELNYFSFGSVLFHEHIHVKRYAYYASLGWSVPNGSQRHFMMEAEAYYLMTTKANPFYVGTSAWFKIGLKENNQELGIGGLTSGNREQAQSLNFVCDKGCQNDTD